MKNIFVFCLKIIFVLAEDNPLLVVGGVRKLLFKDYFSSLVNKETEVLGCPDISLPDYRSPVFGTSLQQFTVNRNSLFPCATALCITVKPSLSSGVMHGLPSAVCMCWNR